MAATFSGADRRPTRSVTGEALIMTNVRAGRETLPVLVDGEIESGASEIVVSEEPSPQLIDWIAGLLTTLFIVLLFIIALSLHV